MIDKNLLVEINLKKMINKVFPLLEVFIFYDKGEGYFYVTIFDEKLYHSPEYQELIMKIKIDYLWENGINNYLFVYEKNISDTYSVMLMNQNFMIDAKMIGIKETNIITSSDNHSFLDLDKISVDICEYNAA